MKHNILIFLLLSLIGCSSTLERNQYLTEVSNNQSRLITEYLKQGTLNVKCPNGGCEVSYTDPSILNNALEMMKPLQETTGFDVMNTFVNRSFDIASNLALPIIALDALKDIGVRQQGDNISVTNTSNTETSNQSIGIEDSFNYEFSSDSIVNDSYNSLEETNTSNITYPNY